MRHQADRARVGAYALSHVIHNIGADRTSPPLACIEPKAETRMPRKSPSASVIGMDASVVESSITC